MLLYFPTYNTYFPPKNQPLKNGVHITSGEAIFFSGKETGLEIVYAMKLPRWLIPVLNPSQP